ncbi:hypothetical protein [Kitasatospora sp. KL5]|uniref:hypothetical protein n=1 Tax=Kitasatospora sp. KL5 TaxID=3425125 RepID=UPI003D6E92F3
MTLEINDEAVRSVLNTLAVHMEAMRAASRQVGGIKTEIEQHFVAACSTSYQQRITNWEERYGKLQQSYADFCGRLQQGKQMIDAAHGEALDLSTGTGPGSHVYHTLNPR